MPHSPYTPDDTLVPEPPAGYSDRVPFQYPTVVLLGLAALLVPIAIVGFGHLLWYAQGPAGFEHVFTVSETADSVSFSLTSGSVALVFLASIVLVTALHELVHGLVYTHLGYEVSYGFVPHLGAFYAAAFHQFQSRNDNIVVGLAPSSSSTSCYSRSCSPRGRSSHSRHSWDSCSTRPVRQGTSTSSRDSSGPHRGRAAMTAISGTATSSSQWKPDRGTRARRRSRLRR